MNKYKIYMIISITILVISIVGSTYALYTKTLSNDVGINTNTPGLDKYINYVKGEDISGGLLTASSTYTNGISSDIEFWKKDDTYDIYGKIILTVNEIGTTLSSSPALKYTLVNNGKILSEGSLQGTSNNTQITLIKNLELQTTKQIYTIYVWLDANEDIGDISNQTLSISVDCTADMIPTLTLTETITNLYNSAEKSTVTNYSITYNYATSVSLMNDRLGGTTSDYDGGNIRYYGESPNNYIYFNCSDYSNQTDTTCELWRIIGVFDGKVKIIRNESIGTYAWDNKPSGVGTSTSDFGSNDWSDSRLMIMLNPTDYSSSFSTDIYAYDKGSYWYGLNSTCYAGSSSGTKTCDFTSIGLKNDITRNMISEETYYLRGYTSSSVYSDVMYNYERTTGSVYSGHSTSWTGKIALAYPSDYGYAVDFNYCGKNLNNYNNIRCTRNWMKSIYADNYNWLLVPNFAFEYAAWYVEPSGYVFNGMTAYGANGVAPVLHLNSNVTVKGDGTSDSPYQIII